MQRMGLAAFSVDLEDYYQVEALRSHCPPARWTEFESRVERNTNRLLDILDKTGTRATFFVLGCIARRFPELIRQVANRGHEIASHGFGHELVYRQTVTEFREDVRQARSLLQDLSGQPVLGYRAPSYTIMKRTLWALPILWDIGHRYDSSIYPIARRRYGIPGAPRWPHHVPCGEGRELVEFPLTTVRVGPINMPATGGAYLRLLPFWFQRWALRSLERQGKPTLLSVHPWELDSQQPRFNVSFRTRWTHYHNLHRAEDRLEVLVRSTRYRPVSHVLHTLGYTL